MTHSYLQLRHVEPAPLGPALEAELGELHALRALDQVVLPRRAGHDVHLIGPAKPGVVDEVVRISSAMTASLPIYPDMTWSVPELPPLVAWLTRNADIVQVATPGPMGIAGLIAARMLGLPVVAQYHTEVAEYAARMTGLPWN